MIPFDTIAFKWASAAVLTFIDCFFAYIACFAFRMFDMVCRQLFRILANIDIRFRMILHVFYFAYVVPVFTCFGYLIVGGLYIGKLRCPFASRNT